MSRAPALVIAPLLLALGCNDKGPLSVGKLVRTQRGGIEVVDAELVRGAGEGEHGRLVAFYFDPGTFQPSLVLNESAQDLSDIGGDLVVNAGFFTPERRPTGLLISSGKVLSPFVREGGAAGSGVFVIDHGRPMLFTRERFTPSVYAEAALAIQAGPRIIEPGGLPGIKSDDGARANRTVIGRDKRGLMVIAVLLGPGGWQSGPTLHETQRALGDAGIGREAKELALDFALNLDGGPSTGLHWRPKDQKAISVPESAPVFSVIKLEQLGARPR